MIQNIQLCDINRASVTHFVVFSSSLVSYNYIIFFCNHDTKIGIICLFDSIDDFMFFF
jgi:hypothetical protein